MEESPQANPRKSVQRELPLIDEVVDARGTYQGLSLGISESRGACTCANASIVAGSRIGGGDGTKTNPALTAMGYIFQVPQIQLL